MDIHSRSSRNMVLSPLHNGEDRFTLNDCSYETAKENVSSLKFDFHALSESSLLSVIQFYCNVMCRSDFGVKHDVEKLLSYGEPSHTVRIQSSVELLEFFSKIPELFLIDGTHVILKNWIVFHVNQQEWLKELLSKRHSVICFPTVLGRIQFYSNVIFAENPQYEMHIHTLFSFREEAPEFIQSRTRKLPNFSSFLSRYPEIFLIRCDHVSLTDNAISFKNLDVWIKKLLKRNMFFNFKSIENLSATIDNGELFKASFYNSFTNEIMDFEALGYFYHKTLQSYDLNGVSRRILEIQSNNVVTPEIQILSKNWKKLKVFLSNYPEVFIINEKNLVFLTHLKGSNGILNKFSCPLESCVDCKNDEKPAIEFYYHVLRELTYEINQLPIKHLFAYRLEIPKDFRKKVKNTDELKKLFLKYPHIFRIKGDYVSLTGNNVTSSNDSIKFISPKNVCIVKNSGITSEKNYEGSVMPMDISFQNNISSSKELLTLKTVNNNKPLKNDDEVSLKSESKAIHKSTELKTNKVINNKAILFYSDFIKKQKNHLVPLNSLIGYRSCAPPDVRIVAKNPIELKKFVSQFPEIFTVIDDKIMFSKINESTKTSSNDCSSQSDSINIKSLDSQQAEAVDFFRKILHNYGYCRVLSLNELFKYKLTSSQSINNISGSNKHEFISFLRKFPNFFIVTSENVIGKKNVNKWSYCGKYENKKFTDSLLVSIYIFFRRYTQNKALVHVDYLFNNAGKYFLYFDRSPIFQSRNDLLLFLALYPHVFYVDCHRVLNLVTSSRLANIGYLRRKRNKTNENMKTPAKINNSFVENKQPMKECNVMPTLEDANKGFKNISSSKLVAFKKKHRKRKNETSLPSVETQKMNEPLSFDKVCGVEKELDIVCNDVNGEDLNSNSSSGKFINSRPETDQMDALKVMKVDEIEDMVFAQFTSDYKNPQNGFLHLRAEKLTSNSDDVLYNRGVCNFGSCDFPLSIKERKDLDKLVREALLFLNHILWENRALPILKIEELFQLFFLKPLEINKYYFKSLEEFIKFLSNFTDDFILCKSYVMPKRDMIFGNFDFASNEEQSVICMLFNFFDLYTQSNNFLSKKKLYKQIGCYFCDINQCQIFKSPEDLVLFLEMFPDIFYVENDLVRNLTISEAINNELKISSGMSNGEEKIVLPKTNQIYPVSIIPKCSVDWKQMVLSRTRLIEDINECKHVTNAILKFEDIIALDCEGANLGAFGTLTLMQIGLKNGQIYIFDIYKDRCMIEAGGLKDILESQSIIKVIHDSRNDAANLFTEYGVEMIKVFDTRVANHVIVTGKSDNKSPKSKLIAIGFNELCVKYDAPINIEKDEMKNVYKINPLFWMDRPLTNDMKAYAALDVASLVQIYEKMLQQLDDNLLSVVWDMSWVHSLSSRP